MTKFRVHLEHDKSVVVEADSYGVVNNGVLRFYRHTKGYFPSDTIRTFNWEYAADVASFGPNRWVWVEKESEESHWDSEPSEESGEQGDG